MTLTPETYYEWELTDANGKLKAFGLANEYSNATIEAMRYLTQYALDGEHLITVRKHETKTVLGTTMKTLSVTFTLTLDLTCNDKLDSDWVAETFLNNSQRFSTLHIEGDPAGVAVQAASSGINQVTTHTMALKMHDERAAIAAKKDELTEKAALTPNPRSPKAILKRFRKQFWSDIFFA
jgi:hypothetical protein